MKANLYLYRDTDKSRWMVMSTRSDLVLSKLGFWFSAEAKDARMVDICYKEYLKIRPKLPRLRKGEGPVPVYMTMEKGD